MGRLFYNGVVYSVDKKDSAYSAVGISGDRIAFLGSGAQAAAMTASERIDLMGGTVLPGFIDSHLHMLSCAQAAGIYQMNEATSIKEIIEEGVRIAAGMDRDGADDSRWLRGRGWNDSLFTDENRFLTRRDLDKISLTRPIIFTRVCGHAACVNTAALKIALSAEGAGAYARLIDADNGVLTESAIGLCSRDAAKHSASRVKELILAVQRNLNSRGITSVHSDDLLSVPGVSAYEIIEAFEELERDGRLAVRVYEQTSFASYDAMGEFIDRGYATGRGGAYFKIGPVKLFQDGSLGARTALLNEPYSNDPGNYGVMMHDARELQKLVDRAYSGHMQIITHAIGDRASDMTCDAYENAMKKYGERDARLAINHVQIVSPTLISRMRERNILAFIQPAFVPTDKAIVRDYIGAERERSAYCWKTMLDGGVMCCGGSDAPVESFDALMGIQAAVTRDRADEATPGWRPEEKLSVSQAIRLFTADAAYGSFDENEKGSLEIGKLADMVVLDGDPYRVEAHRIKDIRVSLTIVGGKDVYTGKSAMDAKDEKDGDFV